ncbi:sigma-70 family RNA polymerase sigma factor [Tenacibaculum piscium]|uniref:RNA polymerase subunit sigma-70 n=1 Tax=Tenacibaculum piscium TaxID=1458515 RepID=A0A2H1YIP9_9FLAO|nr:sigma-70 family RNA polymerase sigma factor [Tenacibaculum piscium]MBE7628473.1 sigma-70 family RNA polymerase sigma factor [Tenacibaculum piscium]MBE7669613.1 sigma-70 family RNA polymerase sigma factor [Tenacibaculum piscium]SOS75261.1 RNA polymerase subunit sigma-70 [Tenacibaculum piscium]
MTKKQAKIATVTSELTTNYIWKKYSDDLKYFILSNVKNASNTDDILQNTFIKIHTKINTLKDTTKLKSWVFSIARNSILDYFKNNNKTFEFANFETSTNIKSAEIHTAKDCLEGILKNLPKKYRIPLLLSDIQGVKQQEIADTLQQSLSTTKSQIQRGRKMITKGFIDCCGFVTNENGKLVGEIKDKKDCKICNL